MSTTNRNKVLFGFGALVAVLIVAIVMWPTNVQREDATGAIGAVQKHRAPQITPQDVVLGNEDVKHQQKVLYADFLADAGKLRAIGSSHDLAAAQLFGRELMQRYEAEARKALSRIEASNAEQAESKIAAARAILAKSALSREDIDSLNHQLGMLAAIADQENAMSRIQRAGEELESIKLDDQEVAVRKLAEVEGLLNRPLMSLSSADEGVYLQAIGSEIETVSNVETANMEQRFALAAENLDARARANIEKSLKDEDAISVRLRAVEAQADNVSRAYSKMGMMANSALLDKHLNAIGTRLRNAQAASRIQADNLKQVESKSQF